ncbi:hypothetical protein [Halosimplex halophilum]|uniref:hypothetical protein n=1 Tax=Halosimplex halophilum TaxID=2559572 RepID=UPI00107F3986|nr:hypothetical protein [Halosimplex halophilum]
MADVESNGRSERLRPDVRVDVRTVEVFERVDEPVFPAVGQRFEAAVVVAATAASGPLVRLQFVQSKRTSQQVKIDQSRFWTFSSEQILPDVRIDVLSVQFVERV